MNPMIVTLLSLDGILLLLLYFDRRRSERDWRDEESSIAAGFKKWRVGSHHSRSPEPQPVAAPPEPAKTQWRVSGSVPLKTWNTLGTALLSNLPSGAQVNAAVDVSFAIDANQARIVTANLTHLISGLELSGLHITRVDPPQKPKRLRVVIRFRDMNPLLQSLLCLSR